VPSPSPPTFRSDISLFTVVILFDVSAHVASSPGFAGISLQFTGSPVTVGAPFLRAVGCVYPYSMRSPTFVLLACPGGGDDLFCFRGLLLLRDPVCFLPCGSALVAGLAGRLGSGSSQGSVCRLPLSPCFALPMVQQVRISGFGGGVSAEGQDFRVHGMWVVMASFAWRPAGGLPRYPFAESSWIVSSGGLGPAGFSFWVWGVVFQAISFIFFMFWQAPPPKKRT